MGTPLLAPAVALLGGIVASVARGWDPRPAALVLIGAWLVGALAAACRRPRLLCGATLAGFAAAGALAGADAARRALATPLRAALVPNLVAGRTPTPLLIDGQLRQDAAPTPYGAALELDVEQVQPGAQAGAAWVPAPGGVRLSVGGAHVAERIDAWRAGRRLRLPATLRRPLAYRNPGVPDQERQLALRGTTLVGSVKSALLVEVVARGSWIAEAAGATRARLRRALGATVGPFSTRSQGIVTAILVGDRAGLDEETERRLQRAGTYHVIAISGGNIALFAAVLLGSVRLLGGGPRLAAAGAIGGLVAYAYLVGGGASVVRATLVAVAYLAARLLDQRTAAVNALALAALAVGVAAPLSVIDVGFVLTFGAALAIVVGVPRMWAPAGDGAGARWDRRVLRAAVAVLAATLAVEVALLPVGAAVFSLVTFAGFLLNLAAIPLMAVAQMAGLVACALSVLSPSGARAAGFVAHLAADGLVESARLVDIAPGLAWRTPPPPLPIVAAYYAALVLWLGAARWPAGRRLGLATAVVLLAWILTAPPRWLDPGRHLLRVTILDVGQGDAVVLRFPTGHAWMVDAGGTTGTFDIGGRVLAPALWALGVRRLDGLVLTHGDPDHLSGALAVVRDFRPRECWEGVPVPPSAPLAALAQAADGVGAIWRTVQTGDRMRLGAVTVTVLHPPLPDWERQRVRNDDSIVLEIRYRDVAVLLPGDIGQLVERALVAEERLVATAGGLVRVVKVPHHGSAGSSGSEWIAATRPVAAIVSAGRGNAYGHPAPAVVARYRAAGALLFRTDEDGAVHVETDGTHVLVRTERGRRVTFPAP